ncbi:MAG: ChaN family lipoprotein, partial [Flavobacteriaceae bacterium]|nr:ChaN family lipoprotein [Flavobacteriaceae bacterium]
MKSQFINLILLIIINHALAQNKPAYQLYNNQGELADYQSMVEELSNSDMVFFGEYHTNPISHWLQLELAKSLYEIRGKNLYLGAEMFENGNQ